MVCYYDLMYDVDEFLEKEEIEDTEWNISAYTLWNLMQKEVSKLHHKLYDNTEMIECVNEMYELVRDLDGFIPYEYAYKNLNLAIPFIGPLKFNSMSSEIVNDGKTGRVYLYPAGKKNAGKKIFIDCDFYGEQGYYGDTANRFLVYGDSPTKGLSKHLDEVNEILKKLAEYGKGYSERKMPKEFVVKSYPFDITFKYPITEEASISICFNKLIDPDNIQYNRYVSYDETVQEHILKSQNEILKRISVRANTLPPFIRDIVTTNMNEILDGEVKIYTKTNNNN